MGLLIFIKGFVLALGTIMPIGSQNALLLKQAINKQHHLISACLFICYDALLITLGVLTGSLLLATDPLIFNLLTWAGIIFLCTYGFSAFKNAICHKNNKKISYLTQVSLRRVVVLGFLVTFLNPHVYIDTVMIIGSVGGQYKNTQQYYFIAGAILASMTWFLTLALAAAKLSTQLNKPSIQRIVDALIGLMMWIIAALLFNTWWQSLQQS